MINTHNEVELYGIINSEFQYNHEVFGERFYNVTVKVKRLSETYDIIPCLISERSVDVSKDMTGTFVKIQGAFRSHNKHVDGKTRLMLAVYVKDIRIDESQQEEFKNSISLKGYIVKQPIYRKTIESKREITDIILASNRSYFRTDYIPCIFWGRNARTASTFEIGKEIKVSGRIQSRKYIKKISETELYEKVAYEVSISKII